MGVGIMANKNALFVMLVGHAHMTVQAWNSIASI